MSKDERKNITFEPVPDTWDWLDAIVGTFDQDFVDAVLEQPPSIERPELDQLFGS